MEDVRCYASRVVATMHNGRRYVYELPKGLTFPQSVSDRYLIRKNLRDALTICSYIDQAETLMNAWLNVSGVLTIDRQKEGRP